MYTTYRRICQHSPLTNTAIFAIIALITLFTLMNTTQTSANEKTIAAFEARRHFGKLIDQVKLGGQFVVEEYGEAVAAVVPLKIYNAWKKDRERFFTTIRKAAEAADLSEEEANKLASEAVKSVRAEAKQT